MFYYIIRFFGFLFYKIFYRVKVLDKENVIKEGKVLVTCNHFCKADVLVVAFLFKRKIYFMGKKEWFDNKFLNWLFTKLGGFPVDRDNPSISTVKTCLSHLKNQDVICVFPEGTRNKVDTNIQEFKQGISMFAIKGKSAIMPVIIYDRLKMFKKNYVIVGKSIDLSKYYETKFNGEVAEKATKEIENNMRELQKELFARVNEINLKKSKKG